MATTAMDYENANGDRFDGELLLSCRHASSATIAVAVSSTKPSNAENGDADICIAEDAPRYERDRSASPRRDDGHDSSRRRSMSPNGHDRYVLPPGQAQTIDPSMHCPSSHSFFAAPRPSITTTTRMMTVPLTRVPTSSSPASTLVLRRPRSPASSRSMVRSRSARS
jgi:hypothetical protein